MAKIMVIDDDVDLAEDLSLILKNAGHQISARDDTEGAVALLKEQKPDLLILDVAHIGCDVSGKSRRRFRSSQRDTEHP
jgi:DNA-binding response OmpR family regulator